MDIRVKISESLKESLKSKDAIAASTIRLMMAALKERDITARGKGHAEGVTDGEILSMLQSMIKQRQESSQTYTENDRPELAEREDTEIEIIRRFMPQQLGASEVDKVIDDVIKELNVSEIRDMGKVMATIKERYAGQIDMGRASGAVKQRLAG